MNVRPTLGLLLLSLALPLAAAEEPAYLSSATPLKSAPARTAETLVELPEKAVVTQLARQGSWIQIRAGEQTGWVRLLVVRPGVPGVAKQGESGLMKLFNVARSGASGTVATTGVRGLDKEQIQNAAPNPAELARMEGYSASEADARKFASGKPALAPAAVPYLNADGTPPAAKE